MNKIFDLIFLSKRQLFVLSVLFLAAGIFISEFISGPYLLLSSLILSFIASLLFFVATREDLSVRFSYPVLILPFFYTLSFSLFYPLIPARLITRVIITSIYAFGLYSLFLTQNIFVVSAIRTINLLRSARIISFLLTIIVLFLLTNVVFSQRFPFYVSSLLIFFTSFFLSFQSLWTYSLNGEFVYETRMYSLLIAFSCAELSLVLNMWPINAAIYSIFITGIFYAYSGLAHAWIEKRLFRGVLWEYVWVGFLAILILIFFSKWGL